MLFAKCGEDDRARFQRRLATLGLPATLAVGGETTSFSFSYDADGTRTMRVETIGEPWQTDEPQGTLLRASNGCTSRPLLRSDFDAAALERLGLGRRLLLDAQGLVRVPAVGPLQLDANYDPELLRHVAILKVAEEEARVLVGDAEPESLAELGVPEIVLTLGERGLDGDRARTRGARSRTAGGRRQRSDGRRRWVRGRVSRRTRRRARTRVRRAACDSARRRIADGPMIAAVDTAEGVLLFDVAEELPLGRGASCRRRRAARRAAARRRDGRRRRDDRRAPRAPPAARDLARRRRDVARGGRRPARRLRGRDRRGRSRPDALRRPQPPLRLGQRRRLLALAAVRAARTSSRSPGSTEANAAPSASERRRNHVAGARHARTESRARFANARCEARARSE